MLRLSEKSLAVALLALTGCTPPAAPQKGPQKVLTEKVTKTDVPIYADFIGTVDGFENAEIRARTAGYVEAIHYQEGKAVKKGDLLFTIDPILAQASVTQAQGSIADAQAALAKADLDVARLKPLVAVNAVSRQEYDNALAAQAAARARLLAAQGSMESSKATLSYTKVTSPIDGVAGLAKVRVGNLVGQAEPTLLTTVSSLDPVRVRFNIPETLYLKVAGRLARFQNEGPDAGVIGPNQGTLQLVLADGSIYPHRGTIAVVDRQLDISTGTLAFDALFPNPDSLLKPGQFGKVRGIVDTKKDAFLVPQRAVKEMQGILQVGVVKDNKVELKTVVATERVGPNWVVEKGLTDGDTIIVEGLLKVRPGDPVAPEDKAAAAAAAKTAQAPTAEEKKAP
ncbi:MAG: efflux RND transporter periplasmic adaptor subunit [Myxococcales bacterium]|nr:efflux RND transporter periplasmic adaptor subunit [Myxococcales bacterium]